MSKRNYYVSDIDVNLKMKKEKFVEKTTSDFKFKSNYMGDVLNLEWLDKIESTCPNIDTIVRKAKFALIKETEVVRMERSRNVTVDSIKDLVKHTNYIEKYNPESNEVIPTKILNVRSEETFNIYENRFLFTLINCLDSFVYKREQELKDLTVNDEKSLLYKGSSEIGSETVHIDLKITSVINNSKDIDKKVKEELKELFKRIKRVKEYISSWKKSEMYKAVEKSRATEIKPPIKKTNVILKNPNFQIAVALWDYLRMYDLDDNENIRDNMNKEQNELIKFIDQSFLKDYCVLDSISKLKSTQKHKMTDYLVLMLIDEIENTLSMIRSCGYDMTDEQLLSLLLKETKNKKNDRLVGSDDVKKRFKSAMDEYLERMQDCI